MICFEKKDNENGQQTDDLRSLWLYREVNSA